MSKMHFVFFHIQKRIKLTKINVSQPNFFPSMPEVLFFTIYTHVILFSIVLIYSDFTPTKNRHFRTFRTTQQLDLARANFLPGLYRKFIVNLGSQQRARTYSRLAVLRCDATRDSRCSFRTLLTYATSCDKTAGFQTVKY